MTNQSLAQKFSVDDYEDCSSCPWCGSGERESWGGALDGFTASRCRTCEVIYLDRRLTNAAQERFYASYLTEVHEQDAALNEARTRMYQLEFELIAPHVQPGRVLDVGCSRGGFLEVFRQNDFECYGVELGAEAAIAARKEFEVFEGEFPRLDFDAQFDLVTFRGVIEHCPDPRAYLDKAWELLAPGGAVFITSTPNSDAHCCELFRERWNQHEPEGHLFHLATRHLDDYFAGRGATKLLERYLYEETPYANPTVDIEQVQLAQELRKRGEDIPFRSPAFWGNMLSAAYRKGV